MPEVSYRTISIRQTIGNISGITRSGVYDTQTHSSVYADVRAALGIEIMQIKLVHTMSESLDERWLPLYVMRCEIVSLVSLSTKIQIINLKYRRENMVKQQLKIVLRDSYWKIIQI